MTTDCRKTRSLRHELRTRDGLLLRPLVWLVTALRPVVVWAWKWGYALYLARRIAKRKPDAEQVRPRPRPVQGSAFMGDKLAN
jgi:hypothetical protein